jgi:hypothetical protein
LPQKSAAFPGHRSGSSPSISSFLFVRELRSPVTIGKILVACLTLPICLVLSSDLRSGPDERLVALAKIRASQMAAPFAFYPHNQCSKTWQDRGTSLLLDAWCESPLYSERDRAALAWTEALTLVSETHAPDDVYRALQAPFTEEERVTLTLLIVTTNIDRHDQWLEPNPSCLPRRLSG